MIADQCQVSLRDTVDLSDLPASELAGYLQWFLKGQLSFVTDSRRPGPQCSTESERAGDPASL